MVGRSLGLLVTATGEFVGETTPSGWRLAGTRAGADPGRAMRRAASWLAQDLDSLEQQLAGFTGVVKVQVAGPWTLAASVETSRGTRLLATRPRAESSLGACGEVVAMHVADVARRIPGASVAVQVDEPMLPAVLAGRLRTASGRGAVRAPGEPEVVAASRGGQWRRARCRSAARRALLRHDVPYESSGGRGSRWSPSTWSIHRQAADAELGQWWDAGRAVALGALPSVDQAGCSARSVAATVGDLWSRIGFDVDAVGRGPGSARPAGWPAPPRVGPGRWRPAARGSRDPGGRLNPRHRGWAA